MADEVEKLRQGMVQVSAAMQDQIDDLSLAQTERLEQVLERVAPGVGAAHPRPGGFRWERVAEELGAALPQQTAQRDLFDRQQDLPLRELAERLATRSPEVEAVEILNDPGASVTERTDASAVLRPQTFEAAVDELREQWDASRQVLEFENTSMMEQLMEKLGDRTRPEQEQRKGMSY